MNPDEAVAMGASIQVCGNTINDLFGITRLRAKKPNSLLMLRQSS